MTDERQQAMFRQPEQPAVRIMGNAVLERACNRLLGMIERNPLLLNGQSMADIDRRLYAECLWEDGMHRIIPSDKKEDFVNIVVKTQDSEVFSRARRYLLEHDLARVSAAAVKSGEQFRARISGAMK